MAAGVIQKPGSKYGPCFGGCGHIDCMNTRKMAEIACRICGQEIGYGVEFFDEGKRIEDGVRVLVHAECLDAEEDAKSPPNPASFFWNVLDVIADGGMGA